MIEKRDTEQGFFPNGRQAETPAIVRSAIANIQLTKKRPFRAGNTLANYLASVQQADEDGRFLCPSQSEDKLFATLEDTLVPREPRDESERTMVWYGNIGSGSSLMRNPIRRDELRDKYDLIGLEMEAAGVINTLPTGVIRGVCDYGDSQKNKIWQPYAAAAAAAYAKGILCAINPKVKAQTDDTVPFIVPFNKNPNFTGREDQLVELEKRLFIGEQTSKIAITGLGGVGKTQLVLELAYRIRAKYRSCSILWIPATDTESFQQAYLDVAQQLNIASRDDKTANVKKLVQLHLSKTTRPWLLIFDNADDINMWVAEAGVEPGSGRLIDYLPRSEQGRIVFTTRDRKTAVKLARQNVVEVPEMDEDVAIQLLQKCLMNPDLVNNRTDTMALLKELTYLPLALVQAAAY